MFGTRATRDLHLSPQCRTRAVQANAQTTGTDSTIVGDRHDGPTFEIHESDELRVVRVDERQQPGDAGTCVTLHGSIRRHRDLVQGTLEPGEFTRTPTLPVHDGIPEDSVEPGHDTPLIAHVADVLDAAHERVLQDLLSLLPRSYPTFDEGQEVATACEQDRESLMISGIGHDGALARAYQPRTVRSPSLAQCVW